MKLEREIKDAHFNSPPFNFHFISHFNTPFNSPFNFPWNKQ